MAKLYHTPKERHAARNAAARRFNRKRSLAATPARQAKLNKQFDTRLDQAQREALRAKFTTMPWPDLIDVAKCYGVATEVQGRDKIISALLNSLKP